MIEFLSAWVLPPGFNLLMLGVGFLLHHYWWKWTGRILMVAGLVSLYLFSTMAAGNRLLYNLQIAPPLEITKHLKNQQKTAIVILGGGRRIASPEYNLEDVVSPLSLERLRYGAKLAKELELPILLSGGQPKGEATPEAVLMNQVMVEYFELPVHYLESASNNTRENAKFTADLLKKNNIGSIVLVTHAWHMKRALAHFKATGMTIYPAPMGFVSKHPFVSSKVRGYYPSSEGLNRSAIALRESIALWWNKPDLVEIEIEEAIVETNPKETLQENFPKQTPSEKNDPNLDKQISNQTKRNTTTQNEEPQEETEITQKITEEQL